MHYRAAQANNCKNMIAISPEATSECYGIICSDAHLCFCDSQTVAHQAPLSMDFSRQEYWSRLPFPSPGGLPDPEIELRSPALQACSLPTEPPGKPHQTGDKNQRYNNSSKCHFLKMSNEMPTPQALPSGHHRAVPGFILRLLS